jgi:hypothetical protein
MQIEVNRLDEYTERDEPVSALQRRFGALDGAAARTTATDQSIFDGLQLDLAFATRGWRRWTVGLGKD